MTRREKIATLLDEDSTLWLSRVINIVIITTIIVTIISIILESVPELEQQFSPIFYTIEGFSLLIFTVEYLLRVWSSPDSKAFYGRRPLKARIRYVFTPMALIDLLAILPGILSLFSVDLRFLRVIRLLRIFKLTRYSSTMNTLLTVIRRESRSFFSVIFVLIIILIIASSGIYLIERDAQPEVFSSIPQSMWWTIVTLSTVGYGDAIPITPMGKVFGGVIMIVGIGIVALPAGILASAFSEQLHKNKKGYRSAVKAALQDGVITPEEYTSLKKLQEKYDLDPEEASDIIQAQFHRLSKKKKHTNKDSNIHQCPHCGEMLDE